MKKHNAQLHCTHHMFHFNPFIAINELWIDGYDKPILINVITVPIHAFKPQALVSFKKYMPPPLSCFKVNICPFPLPHFASIFFAYLWSFRWPNYIVTLPRYFFFRLPHLNIPTGPPLGELDKNIQRTSHFLFFSHWIGYSHFRSGLNWFRN